MLSGGAEVLAVLCGELSFYSGEVLLIDIHSAKPPSSHMPESHDIT